MNVILKQSEARARERFCYDRLSANLNVQVPNRSNKEYYNRNKEKYIEYQKENKDTIKNYKKEHYKHNKDKSKERYNLNIN